MNLKSLILSCLCALCAFTFIGCATPSAKPLSEMTAQEREAYLKQCAIDWLSKPENQQSVKDTLVIAGIQCMKDAVSDDERGTIANYMWASSSFVNTLLTGELITPDKFSKQLTSFMKPSQSAQVAQYTSAMNLAWSQLYQRLSLVKDPSLTKAWLLVFVQAGETVGNAYRTNI